MNSKIKLSPSQQVLLISSLSMLWIVFYKLLFINKTEVFPKAFEIGEIFYGITGAIVSSSIFYYFVVYRPAKREQDKILTVVKERIQKFDLDRILIMKDIYNLKGLESPKELPETFQEFQKICGGILLSSKPPQIFNNPPIQTNNWYEYFDIYFNFQASNKELLRDYWDKLPVEIKTLFHELETNTLRSGLNTFKKNGNSDKLSDLGGPLWHQLRILSKLPKALEENMKL